MTLTPSDPQLADEIERGRQFTASYGVGLAKNRAFVDGNERVALLSVGLFLALNGHRLVVTQVEATLTMLAVASGTLDEKGFAAWLRRHIEKR